MATKVIHSCDTCGDKIDGDPRYFVGIVEFHLVPVGGMVGAIPIPTNKNLIFCSFNCLNTWVNSEQEFRIKNAQSK